MPPKVSGRYQIGQLIGEGGMGTVYGALDLSTGAEVALKILRAELMGNPDAAARFEREAILTSALAGPHAVRVLDVGVADSGEPYMAMERLYGTDLERILEDRGPLPIAEAVWFVIQACEAMKEPHARGIVHRDLKPSNLFMATTAGGPLLKVLDFGISRTVGQGPKLTRPLTTVGTPSYMSPEQARCEQDLDERADVWSLGVILYELVTGVLPFEGASPTATVMAACNSAPVPPRLHRSDLSPAVEAVILRALEKERDKRYSSVGALATALEATLVLPELHTPRTRVEGPTNAAIARRRSPPLWFWATGVTALAGSFVMANSDVATGAPMVETEAPLRDIDDDRIAELEAAFAATASTVFLTTPTTPTACASQAPSSVPVLPAKVVRDPPAAKPVRSALLPTRRPKFDERF